MFVADGPQVISFWLAVVQKPAVQIKAMASPGLAGCKQLRHPVQSPETAWPGSRRQLARSVPYNCTHPPSETSPLAVPEQGIKNLWTLDESALTGQEQFVKDLIRSASFHPSSCVGCCELYSSIHAARWRQTRSPGAVASFAFPLRKAWCSRRATVHSSGRSFGSDPHKTARDSRTSFAPFQTSFRSARLRMPRQQNWLNPQPYQYATTFRREVDAANLLEILSVVHVEI